MRSLSLCLFCIRSVLNKDRTGRHALLRSVIHRIISYEPTSATRTWYRLQLRQAIVMRVLLASLPHSPALRHDHVIDDAILMEGMRALAVFREDQVVTDLEGFHADDAFVGYDAWCLCLGCVQCSRSSLCIAVRWMAITRWIRERFVAHGRAQGVRRLHVIV